MKRRNWLAIVAICAIYLTAAMLIYFCLIELLGFGALSVTVGLIVSFLFAIPAAFGISFLIDE